MKTDAKKYDARKKCIPSDINWCDEKLKVCESNQMCRKSSIFGNFYFQLTDDDIEKLKQGKILFTVDEYGIFIGYKKEVK